MRVLVLTNMLPTETRPAFGVFVRDQIDDLRRLGLDIEVLLIEGSSSRADYLWAVYRLRRMLRRERFDLVHAHYGLSGAVALCQRRAPVVTTFHGSDCSGDIPWQRLVSWGVARLCTPIFVTRKLASNVGCGDADVIPAGVDLDVFQPSDKATARRMLGWRSGVPIALLPGSRHNAVKNPKLFDAAIGHARLTLPDLEGASLEGLTRAQVAMAMSAADVTVMTSTFEGSPVTVKESLACGTPVVSVAVGDVAELIAGLPGCAVVSREPTSIGEAAVRAIAGGHQPGLRDHVISHGRLSTARRVLDVYRRVASAKGRMT